jgi:hypothetical protein
MKFPGPKPDSYLIFSLRFDRKRNKERERKRERERK